MKRFFAAILLSLGLLCVPAAHAQIPTTVVTATILDPNGIAYSGAQVKAVLSAGSTVQVTNQQTCASGGYGSAPCYIPITGTVGPTPADNTGTFTLGMIPNASIYDAQHNPVTSTWGVTVTITPGIALPFGTGPQTFTVPVTISGATQNISTTLNAQAPCLTVYLGVSACSGSGGISGLTFFETDTTIVAQWNTATASNSNITCGAVTGADNGIAANSTSHQAICTGLTPSTGYSTTVTSGLSTSTPMTVTTNPLQARVPLAQLAWGTTVGNGPQQGDGYYTFVSNDGHQYSTQNDGEGFTSVANSGFNMQVGIIDNLSTLLGTNVNTLSNYGAAGTFNGTDGPSGVALSNKLGGMLSIGGTLFALNYRGNGTNSPCTAQLICVQSGNAIASTNHGTSWNNFTTPATFNANGSVPSPVSAFQFGSQNIGGVTPIRYCADDGTLGYTTAGCGIDGANGWIYATWQTTQTDSNKYLLRMLRINFVAQSSTATQYWCGPSPSSLTATTAPAAFVNNANWSTSSACATAIFTASLPEGNPENMEITFVPGANRYVCIIPYFPNVLSGSFNPSIFQVYDAVTPAGPFILINTLNNAPNGYYAPSVAHSTVAGNSLLDAIPLTVMTATFPTNYMLHTLSETLNPTTANLQQTTNYPCSPTENPISFGGNFTTMASQNPVQATAGHVCEPTSTTVPSSISVFTGPPISGDTGGTWPNDQFDDLVIAAINSTGLPGLGLRASVSATTGYFAIITSSGASIDNVSGPGMSTQLVGCSFTPAIGDFFRFTAIGTQLTILRNGTATACTISDATYTSGNPAIFLFATSAVTDAQIQLWDAGGNQAAAPRFSTYTPGFSGAVTVTCPTAGSTVYYTTNGSQPTHSSSTVACSGTVTVTAGTTILRAMAAATDFVDSNPTPPVAY